MILIDDDARGITLERARVRRFRFPGIIEHSQESGALAHVRYHLDDDPRIAVWRYEEGFRTQALFLFDAADAELDRTGRALTLPAGARGSVSAWNDFFVVAFGPPAHSVCALDRSGRERWRLTGSSGVGIRGYGDIGWRRDELFASYFGTKVGFGSIDPATGVIVNRLEPH